MSERAHALTEFTLGGLAIACAALSLHAYADARTAQRVATLESVACPAEGSAVVCRATISIADPTDASRATVIVSGVRARRSLLPRDGAQVHVWVNPAHPAWPVPVLTDAKPGTEMGRALSITGLVLASIVTGSVIYRHL